MEHNSFLYRLYFAVPKRFRKTVVRRILVKEGGHMYSSTIRRIYKDRFDITIGYGTYGGCFDASNIPRGVVFGNYCSIAKTLKIFRANHPKGRFTTHPILYNPKAGFVENDLLHRPPLIIGHDVWIGEGTIILPGVSEIGNGAIIGAGSVVTRNVDPYTIVAGNPAKNIGERFDEEKRKAIETSKWWLLKKHELIRRIPDLDKLVEPTGGKIIH
jgi:acetyltransferase-like isoleucine patch superfamily enzyme